MTSALSTQRMASLVLVIAFAFLLLHVETAAAASCTGRGSYILTGAVKRSTGVGVAGVTMTLTGPGGCSSTTKTGTRGEYLFSNLAKGNYTLTPSKVGCAFSPVSLAFTLTGNTTANFQATCL